MSDCETSGGAGCGRPALSVIIPTYNRCAILRNCLEALMRQTVPAGTFEVIVSDDGSSDETRSVAESAAARNGTLIQYLRQPNKGASAARNQAIRKSQGEILLFINDDTLAVPTMVEEHIRTHAAYQGEQYAVLGRITISPEVPPSLFSKMHLDASFDMLRGKRELDWRAFFTCNLSVKRSFLLKHGLFEEQFKVLHEDLELAERLSHKGLRIIYIEKMLGTHYHHITEKDFLNNARQDGESLARWYRKSPHLGRELAALGLYSTLPLPGRIRYFIADAVINRYSMPLLKSVARSLAATNEEIARKLYSKIYQALKRRAIRAELSRTPQGRSRP